MEAFYLLIFGAAAALAAVLEYGNRMGKDNNVSDSSFLKFRNNYLLVYSLMMGENGAQWEPCTT